MKTCGIIAEFDPFHNGHRYLLEQARRRGATHIAVAMSGSAVQRGSLSVFDKYFRASCAVNNGADLVLELPAPYSCSNAEIFARAGVSALAALGKGVIEQLVFGSEIIDTELIVKASEAADSLKRSDKVSAYIAEGRSYPAAMSRAAHDLFGDSIASVLDAPNSTLALEYCRAIRDTAPFMQPIAVERIGASHNSEEVNGGVASASKIRSMLTSGEDVTGLLPEISDEFCAIGRLDRVFLYHLLAADRSQLLSLPDVDGSLADRILKAAARPCSSTEELLNACKSKNITYARLSRLALHLVLGVRREDIVAPDDIISPLPYVRILAFNERGRELLAAGEHLLPIDTSLARLEKTNEHAERVSLIERRASSLRALGTQNGRSVNEYTVSIKLTKTSE